MLRRHATNENLVRLSAVFGVAGPIVLGALLAIEGKASDGYSHASQTISELGGVQAARPLIQNVNFMVVGVLFVGFAIGLHRGIGGGGSVLGPALVGVFGVFSGVANALLPCDLGCEFQSITGTMHNVTGLMGFVAATAAMFVVSRRLGEDEHWDSLRTFSRAAGALALASLVAWIGVAKAADVGSLDGVLQRLFVGVWFVWIEVMAFRLLRLSKGQPPIADSPDDGRPKSLAEQVS